MAFDVGVLSERPVQFDRPSGSVERALQCQPSGIVGLEGANDPRLKARGLRIPYRGL